VTFIESNSNKENINISVTKNNLIKELKKKNILKSKIKKINKNEKKVKKKENIII